MATDDDDDDADDAPETIGIPVKNEYCICNESKPNEIIGISSKKQMLNNCDASKPQEFPSKLQHLL
jgi:hypothetical protein